jgi:hypothetical protein
MDKDGIEKAAAIINKFRRESKQFDFKKKIMLTRIWIDILIKAEEYEMAWALDNERMYLVRLRVEEKRESRTFRQKMRYRWIKLKRKFMK